MAFQSFNKVVKGYENLANWKRKHQANGEKTTKMLVETTAVVGASFAFAYLNGRYGDADGEYKIAGAVPLDLVTALALYGLGWMGFMGKYGEVGTALANGAIAQYTARKAFAWGQGARGVVPTAAAGMMYAGPWNPAALGSGQTWGPGWGNAATAHAPTVAGWSQPWSPYRT